MRCESARNLLLILQLTSLLPQNDDCPIEWYHLSCLGLERAPTGTWICDVCTGAIAKRTQQVVAEKKHKKRRARF